MAYAKPEQKKIIFKNNQIFNYLEQVYPNLFLTFSKCDKVTTLPYSKLSEILTCQKEIA